jgi:PBSX family phage terminase large subunit
VASWAPTGAIIPGTGTMGLKQLRSVRDSQGRVNLWEGSVRSGKTYASILRFLIFVMTAPPGGEIILVGKNRDSIYRNVFKPIEEAAGLKQFSAMVHYRSGATQGWIFGRMVHVIGANDAKAESKIRGMTVAGAYVDEVTVIPRDFFKQLLARMSVTGAQMFATTNPDSPAHWLKTDYIDKLAELPSWRRFHFTMDDNPSLDPQYVADLKLEYTGLWYRRFILGLWVSAEGAIFDMFDAKRHVRRWDLAPRIVEYQSIGVDYGTTNSSAGLILGRSIETQANGNVGSRLWLLDEWRTDPKKTGHRLAPSVQAQQFMDWRKTPHLPYAASLPMPPTIVDPAANHFREELYRAPHNHTTSKAFNDVNSGIGTMASLLSEGLLMMTDRCAGLISEFPGYSWSEKKSDEGVDEPVKVADHSLDAARYAIATTENRWHDALNWHESPLLAA